jgi:hypothetical protein
MTTIDLLQPNANPHAARPAGSSASALPILMKNRLALIAAQLRRSVRSFSRVLSGNADERLDRYLEQATDHADLKRRLQSWQALGRQEAMTRLIPQRH